MYISFYAAVSASFLGSACRSGCSSGAAHLSQCRLELQRSPLRGQRDEALGGNGGLMGHRGLEVIEPGMLVSCRRHIAMACGTYDANNEVSICRRWPVWAINTCVAISMHLSLKVDVGREILRRCVRRY